MTRPSSKIAVVYLGNLAKVAAVIYNAPGVELKACLIEAGDSPEGDFKEIGKKMDFRVISVRSDSDVRAALRDVGGADLGLIANFGILLSGPTIAAPRMGFVNAHFGLLPENPGRNPVVRALKDRSKVTGVTLHSVTKKVDGGPIIEKRTVSVPAKGGGAETFDKLTDVSCLLIRRYLESLTA